jgi:ribosomal protein S18 acetylase RimI-like enzyme
MEFELTREMIDKIAFAMEDQGVRYLVDSRTGELVTPAPDSAAPPEEALVPLPRWGSAEGFHLMESFVTTLRNPVYRDLLAEALATGKGVFRAFKDTLKRNKEIEKLWFLYKEKRLRGVIISWYNANREARGLSKLPPEPEETADLVASDFSFVWSGAGRAGEILRLDREAFGELFPQEEPGAVEARYREKRRSAPAPDSPGAVTLVAVTPDGELAGYAWGALDGSTVHIVQILVIRELRGIGLGETLMRTFVTEIRGRGVAMLTTELAGKSLRFSSFFRSLGFNPVSEVLECSLEDLP